MRVHLGYLLLVPLFAAVAMGWSPEVVRAVGVGWLSYLVYALGVGTSYALSTHPVRMAAVVLAVPAELAAENLLFHHSLGFFFMEAAFIEVTAFTGGLFVAMAIHRPSGCVGVVFGAGLVGCSLFAFGSPLLDHYRDLSPYALAMPGAALLTAGWGYTQIVLPSARSFSAPPPLLRFGGGWIGRLFAPGPDEEMIGPGVSARARDAARRAGPPRPRGLPAAAAETGRGAGRAVVPSPPAGGEGQGEGESLTPL